MADNDSITSNIFSPVSDMSETWSDQQSNFNGDDKFSTMQGIYSVEDHDTYSSLQQQGFGVFGLTVRPMSPRPLNTTIPLGSDDAYGVSNEDMRWSSNGPMLGMDYAQWSVGRGRGSFAEFAGASYPLNETSHRLFDLGHVGSAASFATGSNASMSSPAYTNFTYNSTGAAASIEQASSTTAYSSYSCNDTAVNPADVVVCNNHPSVNKVGFYEDIPRSYIPKYDTSYLSCDKGPTYLVSHQTSNQIWNYGPNVCASQLMTPNTVFPQDVMRLELPLAMSTSGSSQGNGTESSNSSACSSGDTSGDYSDAQSFTKQPASIRRHRQMLPSEPIIRREEVSALPRNGSSDSNRGKSSAAVEDAQRSAIDKEALSRLSSVKSNGAQAPKRSGLKKIEPKPVKENSNANKVIPSNGAGSRSGDQPRSDKDNFLIQSKLAGMSYKEIRRRGKFTEAESTLRGRFRTLTKHKTARVRRPEWDENDNRLLKKAVRKLSQHTEANKGKVPWKQVAEYIANNGGSYHFGNATCRKRWDELQAGQQ